MHSLKPLSGWVYLLPRSGTMFPFPKWLPDNGNAFSKDLTAQTENKKMVSLTGKLKAFA